MGCRVACEIQVRESGDNLEAVADGTASSAALSEDLPVLDPSDGWFDAGAEALVGSVVVVVDDASVGSAAWAGDGGDFRVAAASSRTNQRTRCDYAADTRAASAAKQARAAEVAATIVATHGNTITVEDCRISTWARLWGKRIALFSPGMLVAALAAECAATGGQFYRAGTHATAMSQHCLCGARVPKTLDQRTHDCPHCGLRGDRDIVSAALAACVDLADREDPRTARVDYGLAHALRDGLASQQGWEGSVNRHPPPPSPDGGSARTGSHPPWPLLNKRHPAHPRTDHAPSVDVTGPAENNQHPS